MSDAAIPPFSETDPRWIRADALRAQLGIKHAMFNRIHSEINGKAFEHRPSTKPGTPLWIFSPGWWEARLRGTPAGEMRGKTKAEFYDGESSEAKYLALIRSLVPASEVAAIFSEIATEIREAIATARKINPQAADRMQEAIERAGAKLKARFNINGHQPGTNGDTGRSGGDLRPRLNSATAAHAS